MHPFHFHRKSHCMASFVLSRLFLDFILKTPLIWVNCLISVINEFRSVRSWNDLSIIWFVINHQSASFVSNWNLSTDCITLKICLNLESIIIYKYRSLPFVIARSSSLEPHSDRFLSCSWSHTSTLSVSSICIKNLKFKMSITRVFPGVSNSCITIWNILSTYRVVDFIGRDVAITWTHQKQSSIIWVTTASNK